MNAPWNVVLVGSGWAHHAASVVQADPLVRLTALVARGSERSQGLAARLGVPLVRSVDELPPNAFPRIAVVAVDEQVTPAIARALLQRGCDVLCAHPVARSATEVQELSGLAAHHGRLIATDYTLGIVPGALLARDAMGDEDGPLLRLTIEHPGRLLPMALHLALFFAGPVRGVHASRQVPSGLQSHAKSSPGAFPPSLLLEHESGVISSLVSVTHARLEEAFRCTLSGARSRLDLELPRGAVWRVQVSHGGQSSYGLLADGDSTQADPFGALMQTMVTSFLHAARTGVPAPCPLSEEVHVRAVWNAIPLALRTHARASVELPR